MNEEPMRIAVISDIHGNDTAFQQVLRDMETSRIDATVCLGDNVGYGPEPVQIIRRMQRLKIPCVKGNHEQAVTHCDYLNWFNPVARESLKKTMAMLPDDALAYIHGLPSNLVLYGSRFVHGYPPNFIDTYLFEASRQIIKMTLSEIQERICFVGHTHELKIIGCDGVGCEHRTLSKGVVQHLRKENKYIVNTGSVGQPRDGNNNAKYVIWDTTADTLEAKFVPYDIATVARKIVEAGLPKIHADRLW